MNNHGEHSDLPSYFTSKDWTLEGILSQSDRFSPVLRVSVLGLTDEQIRDHIARHESSGEPLILCDLDKLPTWDHELLSLKWLRENCANQVMPTRDVHTRTDAEMSFEAFFDYVDTVPMFATTDEPQRLYGKDAPCSSQWTEWLHSGAIPSTVVPLGTGDLLHFFDDEERPETLMTYFGVGDTYTPCHKDPCSSQGQNLMTYAEPSSSALWFFTPSDESYNVARHFSREFGTELDFESKFLQLHEFQGLPCRVYVCEQIVGDLVLVPRRSCHQVINKGGLTIKTSWSRMTVAGLVEAIQEECPIYRRVCRPEVYRTRLLCYRTLKAVCEEAETESNNPSAAEFVNERFHTLSRLVPVFDEVLASEWSPQNLTIPHYTGRHMPSCDFCGADIFQSFFQCKECSEFENNMEGETYHICATCYVEGRSCVCRVMSPVQHRPFEVLLDVRNNAAGLYHQDADFDAIDKEFLAQMISNRVFRAAMALYTSRTLREEDSPKVTRIRRCSAVVSKQDLSHDAPAESLARCGQNGCKRALCFLHSLILRRSHSSDDILDTESVLIYHSKHGGSLSNSTVIPNVKDEFNGIFGVDYKKPYIKRRPGVITKGVPNGPLKPYIRLTWAAITFPYCQPIDAQRSYPGWYDKERSRVPREVLIEANGEAASDVGDVGSDALSAMSVNQESDGYTPQTASRKRTKSRTKLPKSRKSRKGKEVATSSDSGEMQESMDSLDDWDNAFSPHPSRRPAKRPRYTNIADHGVEAPEAGPSRLDQGSNLSSEDRIVVHPRSKLLDETESSTLTPLNEEAENATIIDPGELSLPDFGVPLGLAEDDNRTFLIDAYNEICRTACDSRGLNKARLLSQLERMGRILRAPSPYKTPTEFMGMAKTLPKFDVRMSLAQPNGSDSVSGSVSTADTPE